MTGPATPLSIHTAPDVLTVTEAAKLLRLGRNAMYEAVRTNQVPAVRIGKRLLIPKSTIIRLLNSEPKEEPCGGASNNG